MTEYRRVINNSFLHQNVKSGHIVTSPQPNNMYCKLCGIPVIWNYCIFLAKTLFYSLIKGILILIYTCLSNNNHKLYPSGFYRHTQQSKFFIHPLDVHVFPPSENVSCDNLHLWHFLLLHPLHNFSNAFLHLLVLFCHHDWLLVIWILYHFDKYHNDILYQNFLNIFLVGSNGQKIVTWIFIGR